MKESLLDTILPLLIIKFCSPFPLRLLSSSLSALLTSRSLVVRSGVINIFPSLVCSQLNLFITVWLCCFFSSFTSSNLALLLDDLPSLDIFYICKIWVLQTQTQAENQPSHGLKKNCLLVYCEWSSYIFCILDPCTHQYSLNSWIFYHWGSGLFRSGVCPSVHPLGKTVRNLSGTKDSRQ